MPRALDNVGGIPPGRREWSWPWQAFPYVEQGNLTNLAASSANDTVIQTTPIPLDSCPSRRSVTVYGSAKTAKGDYAGNAGGDPLSGNGANGVVVRTGTRTRALTDISDGTANTVMAGEKMMRTDQFGVEWPDNEPYISVGYDLDVVRSAATARWHDANAAPPAGSRGPLPDVAASPPASNASGRADSNFSFLGSSHTSEANFVMCDGSVRVIQYTPDPTTFRRLCMTADGQVIPDL